MVCAAASVPAALQHGPSVAPSSSAAPFARVRTRPGLQTRCGCPRGGEGCPALVGGSLCGGGGKPVPLPGRGSCTLGRRQPPRAAPAFLTLPGALPCWGARPLGGDACLSSNRAGSRLPASTASTAADACAGAKAGTGGAQGAEEEEDEYGEAVRAIWDGVTGDIEASWQGKGRGGGGQGGGGGWVIGVDPDVSGALALLRPYEGGNEGGGSAGGVEAAVHDVPVVLERVGKMNRRRHDPVALHALLTSLEIPEGTPAYVEKPTPSPQNGKLGWYGSGFGYGVWVALLTAAGAKVMPIRAPVWKKRMGLLRQPKDASRELAVQAFPGCSGDLRRKKDHGRAEALLIGAWGQLGRAERAVLEEQEGEGERRKEGKDEGAGRW